jgi:hypothetical protein
MANGGATPTTQSVIHQPDVATPTDILVMGNSALAINQNGTKAARYDSNGKWIEYSAVGNLAGIYVGAALTRMEWGNEILFTMQTPSSGGMPNSGDLLWVGVSSNDLYTSADPSGLKVAAFRYAPGTDATAFWRAYTADGSSNSEVTDTGVAIVADTKYLLSVKLSSTDVKFYINGTLVATHSTHIPPTGFSMAYYAAQSDSDSHSKFRFGKIVNTAS